MRQKLGEMLIEAGAIDELQLRSALADQRRWGRPLGKTLVEMRLISEEDMVQVLAKQLNLPAVILDGRTIPQHVLDLVPAFLVRQHLVVPFEAAGRFLDLAMADPTNLGVIDEIRIRAQLNVRPYLTGPRMIERAIDRYYVKSMRQQADFEIPLPADPSLTIEPAGPIDVRDGLRTFQRAPAQPPEPSPSRDREIDALQDRISMLEAVVERDEAVLRKLLSLLIEKGIATRDEIVERLG